MIRRCCFVLRSVSVYLFVKWEFFFKKKRSKWLTLTWDRKINILQTSEHWRESNAIWWMKYNFTFMPTHITSVFSTTTTTSFSSSPLCYPLFLSLLRLPILIMYWYKETYIVKKTETQCIWSILLYLWTLNKLASGYNVFFILQPSRFQKLKYNYIIR